MDGCGSRLMEATSSRSTHFIRATRPTQHHPEEVFRLDGNEIRIKPVTLPHHDKVSEEEWKRYAGPEGYVKNQGFYLYRNRRLIIHGTWFRLARQSELTKTLTRSNRHAK